MSVKPKTKLARKRKSNPSPAASPSAAPALARKQGQTRSPSAVSGEIPVAECIHADAGTMADATGLSFHAMIMDELKALGCIARAEADSDREHENAAGHEDEPDCERGPHHLHYDRTKGWMLRVTVDLGKNVIGKRLKFRLRTRDAQEAEKARDLVLATLKRLGLTVRLRMQGRWERGRVALPLKETRRPASK